MSDPWDVVIVGGGPVGLATAIGARQRGVRVLVLERRPAPCDKACGEGLMPEALSYLEALGVAPPAGRTFAGIRYQDGPLCAVGRFSDGAGRGVRRTVLRAALLERARTLGVAIEQEAVTGLVRECGRFRVTTARGAPEARFVVAADGLRSALRQAAGLALARRGGSARFGVRQHFALALPSGLVDLVQVEWGARCEAYLTPVGAGEVGVALLARAPEWAARGGLPPLAALLHQVPRVRDLLRGAVATSAPRGAGPLRQHVRAVVRDNLALVGDASGYIDAITGEGLALGFGQAQALGAALARDDLGGYSRAHRRLARRPAALTEATLLLSSHPRLRRRVLGTLAARPWLFDRLLAAHGRTLGALPTAALVLEVLLQAPGGRSPGATEAEPEEGRGRSVPPMR